MHYVKIMGLVPLYVLQAWLSVKFVTLRKYLEFMRELYESYFLYIFLRWVCVREKERESVCEVAVGNVLQQHSRL